MSGSLELKEEALVAQDNRIILLEDTVEKLKSQILKISHFQNNSNKPSEEEHQENMALPDILRNVGMLKMLLTYKASFNTAHNLLNNANGQINNFINDMANVRNEMSLKSSIINY
ncbi:unnamed protein product [Rhizophagus irregularis]|nr:unnamed protein product [Rhizophagus irregularis]